MAIQAETLEVQVRASGVDTTVRDVNRVPTAVNRAATATEQAGARAKRGGMGFSAAGALVKAAAGTMVVSLGTKVIGAASDLNEELSKTGVVFGPAADKVIKNADNMARRFGLTKSTILEAAGGIGLVAKASGLAQGPAANLSNKLARLAADASSFYNVPITEALDAMKSGLVGEAEPMRRFGVLLSEAAVKTEAVRLGIAKQTDELTEGQKVQARSSLILKGMSDASGDLARTQDSVANRLREVQGRISNYAAELGTKALPYVADFLGALVDTAPKIIEQGQAIGQSLLPALQKMVDVGQGAVQVYQSIPDPLKDTAFQIGAVALAVSKGSSLIHTGVDYLSQYRDRMNEAGRATIALRGTAGIIGGTVMALGQLADTSTESGRAVKSATDVMGGALMGFAVGGPVGAAVGGLAGLLMNQLAPANNTAADSFDANREAARAFKDTLDQTTGAITRATRAQALKALQDTTAVEAGNKLGIATRDLIGATLGEEGARKRVMVAIKAADKLRGDEIPRLKNGVAAHNALEQALFGVKGMSEGTADAFRKQQRALKQQIEDTKTWRQALKGIPPRVQTILENKNYDVSRRQVLDLVRKYDLTPKQKTTLFKALGIEKVAKDAKHASDNVNALGKINAKAKADLDDKATPKAKGLRSLLMGPLDGTHAKPKATLVDQATPKIKGVQGDLGRLGRTVANATARVTDAASSVIQRVTGNLNTLDGKVATTFVRTIYQAQGKADRMMGSADGSTVPGPRQPYGDKVPYLLAPGEEVISNRFGQADRHRGLLKAINQNRLADGGTADKNGGKGDGPALPKDPETRKQVLGLQIEIRDLRKELAKQGKDALTGLERKQAQASLAATLKELAAVRKGPEPEKPVNWGWLGNLADGIKKAIDGSAVLKQFKDTIRQNTKGKQEKDLLGMKALDKMAAKNDRLANVQEKLANAIAERDRVKQEADSFRGTVQEGISRQANVLNAGRDAGNIAASLGVQVGKAQEFAAAIQALRGKGYSDGIVMQVASAGIEGGLEIAKALMAASPGEAQAITQSFNTIQTIAQQASTGVTGQMYDTGIQAAEGVVKGLEDREAKIEQTLIRIAEKIAKVLRKRLKVKSPSRLTAEIGGFVGEGLVVGLASKESRITDKAARIGSLLAAGVQTGIGTGPTLPASLSGTQGLTPAGLGAGVGGRGVTFQFQTYNPVAEPASRTTNKALDRVASLSLV